MTLRGLCDNVHLKETNRLVIRHPAHGAHAHGVEAVAASAAMTTVSVFPGFMPVVVSTASRWNGRHSNGMVSSRKAPIPAADFFMQSNRLSNVLFQTRYPKHVA